jgi:hypothetical protein
MRNLKFARALMFFAAFAAAVAGSTAQAAEKTQVVDVTGIQSYDEFGSPDNTVIVLDLGSLATVTSIAWNVNITAFSPSWLSEITVFFSSSDGSEGVYLTPSLTDGPGTESQADGASLVDLGLSFNVGTDGKLYIEFGEGFKDFDAGVADGQWNSGTLTIGYDDHIAVAPVPEPETYAMLLLGLGAVGAIARRRRNV